jgi:hypothetical protein
LVTTDVIVIDSNYLTSSIRQTEEQLDLGLDEHDILSFLFNVLKHKHNAVEELDYGLLDLYRNKQPNYLLLQNETEVILKLIKELGLFLFNELVNYNCYRKNNLIYYPRLDVFNQNMLSYRISVSPLILIPINFKDCL